jgi:hypothetical protein
MQTNDNWEEKGILNEELSALRQIQMEYTTLMLFLKDIRESLNNAYEIDGYTLEGLTKTAELLESQIDGYNHTSLAVSGLSCTISEIHDRLLSDLKKIN